jgi:hypothetical protein
MRMLVPLGVVTRTVACPSHVIAVPLSSGMKVFSEKQDCMEYRPKNGSLPIRLADLIRLAAQGCTPSPLGKSGDLFSSSWRGVIGWATARCLKTSELVVSRGCCSLGRG